MRIDGTLSQWNDNDNCGSIAPTRGGPEVFVDLAAFARHEHQRRPLLHERLSFELALDRNGNLRARGVRRPARCGLVARLRAAAHPTPRKRKRVGQGAAIFLVIASAAYLLSAYLLTVSGQPPAQAQEAQEMQQPGPHEGLYADIRRTASLH
jgi:cytochrome c-type biogenesis protein CcmH/NrfG